MKQLFTCLLSVSLLLTACGEAEKKTSNTDTFTDPIADNHDNLLNTYPEVPETSTILNTGDTGTAVYAICQQRYATPLALLKKEADALGAKLVVAILSPEIGDAITVSTRKGIPFILETAQQQGIEAYDLTTPMAGYTSKQITQMPLDGHWSEQGAAIVADLFAPILTKNSAHKATKTFTDAERPAVLGDLAPNQNEALDGGKNIPYQLITNSQGFRMDQPLVFPKTKQHVLFLGDSQIYSPFLDNQQTPTAQLQQKFPGTAIINAGVVGYTVEDCLALLAEKAKYAEPDLIIFVTNPNDIGDFYFTQRNRMGRSKKAHEPSSTELSLYQQLFSAKQP